MLELPRRTFLKGALAGAGLAAVRATPASALAGLAPGPSGSATPVDHTVVVMMENRSVDHYLGWLAHERGGIDAHQTLTFPDATGQPVTTEPWGDGSAHEDWAGCGYNDPGHGWTSGRAQLNGKTWSGYVPSDPATYADGWLLEGSGNDEFALSWYGPEDIPVTAALARGFTTFDRYFCSTLTSTYPNREYMHSATSNGIDNNDFPPERGYPTGFDWPTIWTMLDAKGVSWAYYYSNLPVIALWGPRHAHGARHISTYYEDAATGRLPQVAFIDPWFVGPEGLANDDHPHADLRLGQEFLAGVVGAFIESPNWTSGALFLTYDEWGGFFDHVPPPVVPDAFAAEGFGQLGFRVPTMLVSPFARGGRVDHGIYDHTSILRFIEHNHGLGSLTVRDAAANNILGAFDFGLDPNAEIDLDDLRYTAPAEARVPCEARGHTAPASDLYRLADIGWFERWGFRTDHRFVDSFRSMPAGA